MSNVAKTKKSSKACLKITNQNCRNCKRKSSQQLKNHKLPNDKHLI